MNIEQACDKFDKGSEYFYAKKYKRALKTFEEVESHLVNDETYGDTLLFLIASCHYFLRKFDKAQPYIEKVKIGNINNKVVKLYLRIYFFTHIHLNKYEEMIKHYTQIINSEIDVQIKGYSYFYLGYIKQEQELFEEALNYYNKYVLLVPETSINYSNIAYCFFKLDEFDRADTYIQKAIGQYENRIFELVLTAEIHRVLYGEEPAYELMYKAILKEQSKIIDKSLLLTPMEEHFLQNVMEYYKKEKDNIEKSIIGKSSVKSSLLHPQKAQISHNQIESKVIMDEGIDEPITDKPIKPEQEQMQEQPQQNNIKLQVHEAMDNNESEIIPVEQQVVREIAVIKNQMALRGKQQIEKQNQLQNERLNTLNANNELSHHHHDDNDLISFQSMHCQKTIPFIKHQATHSNAQTPEMRNQDNQFLKFDDESKASQARQFFPGSQSSQPIRFESLVSKSDVIKGSQASLRNIETPVQNRTNQNKSDATPGFQTPSQF